MDHLEALEQLHFFMDLPLPSRMACRPFKVKHFFGNLQEQKGLPP